MGPSFFGYLQFLIERRNVTWPFFTHWLFKVNLSLDVPLLFLKNLIRRMSSNFLRSYLLIYLFYFVYSSKHNLNTVEIHNSFLFFVILCAYIGTKQYRLSLFHVYIFFPKETCKIGYDFIFLWCQIGHILFMRTKNVICMLFILNWAQKKKIPKIKREIFFFMLSHTVVCKYIYMYLCIYIVGKHRLK